MTVQRQGKTFLSIILVVALAFTIAFIPTSVNSLNLEKNQTVLVSMAGVDSSDMTDRFIIKYKDENGSENLIGSIKNLVKKVTKYKSKTNKHFDFVTTNSKMRKDELIAELNSKNLYQLIDYIQQDIELSLSSEDPSFDSQWGLYNSTPVNAVQNLAVLPDFRIDAGAIGAWGEAQGDGVTVAVIDTGVDITHEDLARNIWLNAAEIAGDGIDNDANGLVDDVNGWNLFDENNQVYSAGDSDHGTHVAGIIAAEKDNSTGIAGVAPNVKIMPLKVFNNGTAYTSDIIEAIDYAENMGAKIVNCSWGTTVDNPALRETMQQSNMLFVSAAGNSGVNIDTNPVYPASFAGNNILAVASLGRDGNLAATSNYGETTTLTGAPGEEIISTLPGNTYGYRSGTSMAAAFVSGEAALILSKFGSITAGEIKQKIVDSSDRLSTLVGKVYRGNKINAENAVKGLSSDTIISIGDSGSQDVASAVYGQDIDGGFSTFYTTPQTVTGNVFSIPAEGVNGQLNLKLMGNTETNIVANGNFANGTTGWTPAYGVLSTANNILSVTANGTNYYVRSDETTSSPIIAGHKYYAQAKMRITNSSCLRIGISIDGSTGGIDAYTYQESPAPNQWYLISTIYTTTDHTGNVLIRLRETYPDAATANGKVMEVKEVMAIDLTSRFGAGNEPDAATCASRYANWFDGTKSTLGGRVLSHGKNYVKNGNCEESTKYWTTGGNVTSFTIESGRFKLVTSGTGYAYQLIKVEANTDYYLSGNTDTGIRVYTNDIATLLRSGAGTFNTGTNTEVAVLIRNSGAAVGHADSIMLIKDTSAPSAYEPYTSTEIFFPTIGNSLPNGTKDELDVSTGVKTQRVSGWTIIEGAAITGISTQTNVDIIYAPLSNMSTSIVNNVIDGGIYVPGWTETNVSGIDNVNNIGKYYAYTGYIYFVITKGQSLAYWQNPSNFSVSLTYQLSTPITTSLDIPPLTCYAGGTVYIDNAVRDTAVYGNGIAVSDSGLPIKSLESVYKMAGGTMTPVNLSNVTVASNGFTFAITGAQNGDQYQYTYLYDSSLSTLPTVEFVVPTSQADQINDNTNMTEQQAEIINNLLARVEKLEEQAASGAATQMNAGPFKINCTVNNNISLVLTASNSKDFSSRKFTVIYNASELDVVDLSAETSTLETGICNVSGTNIVITRVDPGVIEFFIYNPVDDGSSFSGAVNTIIFRPKITGQVTISYTVQ